MLRIEANCLVALAALLTIFLKVDGTRARDLLPGDEDVIVKDWNFREGDALGWRTMHNLTPIQVANDVLKTKATGDDAYMGVGGLDIDTSAVSHVLCRMRSTEPGTCQIYFSTSVSPDPARNAVPSFYCPGDNEFRCFEAKLSGQRGWEGRLRLFRIDPVNGSGTTASIEVDYVRLIQKAPRLAVARFSPNNVWVKPGDEITLTFTVANTGGGSIPDINAFLDFPDGTSQQTGKGSAKPMQLDEAKLTYTTTWRIRAPNVPVQTYRARLMLGGRALASAESHVFSFGVADRPKPSGKPRAAKTDYGAVIENDLISLGLYRSNAGIVGGVLRTRESAETQWKIAGVCLPLATVAIRADEQAKWLAPQFEEVRERGNSLTLEHRLPEGIGSVTLSFEVKPGANIIHVVSRLQSDSESGLLRFGGPTLLAGAGSYGPEKETAVFPGIEFLDALQRSSDTELMGDGVGYRPIPPPYQITVPMMAVRSDDVLFGRMWDALQKWDGEQQMLMGEFASPNFLDDQPNHLMATFVPTWPQWTSANHRSAEKPYQLNPNTQIVLDEHIFAVAGADISQAVPLWYRVYCIPKAPKLAKPLEQTYADLIQGWAQTCYYPELDKFVNHWRMGQEPYPSPDLKGHILSYYLETGDERWIKHCRISHDAKLLDILGPLFPNLGSGGPPKNIASQREDGTWAYNCPAHVAKRAEEFTRGKRHNLGEPGSTCVGVCATNARGILAYALSTGDPEAERAGLKALEAMMRFKVPAGSQTWEVHKDIPDIYAAGLAVDCFRAGYELTGDKRYLDQAIYWAYTGLPFLYSYQVPNTGPNAVCNVPGDPRTKGDDPFQGSHRSSDVFQDPDRHVTPYGSIPVIGTSFYVVSWFGNLVQWCGLCWADSVYALLEHVDDPILEAAADGVLYSGCQQTFDKEPVVGLLPDTWHLGPNIIYPAFIGPVRVESPLRKKLDKPTFTTIMTIVARAEGQRCHINSRGGIYDALLDGGKLIWTERYPIGQTCDSVLIGLRQPKSVTVAGRTLSRAEDAAKVSEGWQYVAESGRLFLRVKHSDERLQIIILQTAHHNEQ